MSNDLAVFSTGKLPQAVHDLRELFSQSHIAFLLGAGCSKPAGLPLMPELTDSVLGYECLQEETKKLIDAVRESFSGASNATIEDYMSEIVDHLSIAKRRTLRGATQSKVKLGGLGCVRQ